MTDKEAYIQHLFDTSAGDYLLGPFSAIIPSTRVMELIYSDGTTKKAVITASNANMTENPLTGEVDITVKLTLNKEVTNV